MKIRKLLVLALLLSVTPALPNMNVQAKYLTLDEALALEDKAKAGDAQAQYDLGNYYKSNGAYKTALKWYQAAYENGYKMAKDKIDEVEKKVNASDERKPYKTKITYNNLVRNPEDYTGQKVAFYCKVIGIVEGKVNQILLAVERNENCIIYGEYSPSIVSSRILENDEIIIYGISAGLVDLGDNTAIPGVNIKLIDASLSLNDIMNFKGVH